MARQRSQLRQTLFKCIGMGVLLTMLLPTAPLEAATAKSPREGAWQESSRSIAPEADCVVPTSGDWVITQSCMLVADAAPLERVIVQNNATLTVPNGVTLAVDFTNYHLRVVNGARVLVQNGGKIDTLKVLLKGLEVTQAVQNLEGTLPLVQFKQTTVRAYVEGIAGTVEDVVLRLHGRRNGQPLPGSPLSMQNPGGAITAGNNTLSQRDQLGSSANFSLPASWRSGTVELRIEAVGQGLGCNEQAGTNNDCRVTADFQATDVPLYWVVPLNTGTAGSPALVANTEIFSQRDALERVFPVQDVAWVTQPWQAVSTTTVSNAIADLNDYYISVLLSWVLGFIGSGSPPFLLPDQIYGFTSTSGGLSNPIWSGGLGVVARGFRGTSRELTMAHEINHNLDTSSEGTWGRHVGNPDDDTWGATNPNRDLDWGCGASGPDPNWPRNPNQDDEIGEVGFDTLLPWLDGAGTRDTVIIDNFPDFMSYCQSEDEPGNPDEQLPTKWISPYRWQSLFGSFASFQSATAKALQQEVQPVVYISASLNVDGSGSLEPALVQPGLPTQNIKPGDYIIVIENGQGAAVLRQPFFVSFVDVEGEPLTTVRSSFQMPLPSGAARIVLLRGDEVLDTIQVSRAAPEIRVLAPNGGENWRGVQSVQWESRDADGDPLWYSVLYTPDDGRTWRPLAWNIMGTSLEVNTDVLLAGSDAARVRVIASDGFNTNQDDSDGIFSVVPKPPVAMIITPHEGDSFGLGDRILLRGEGWDVEDGTLLGDTLRWELTNGQVLGYGDELEFLGRELGVGRHTVRLVATDSDGLSGMAEVSISISQ